MLFSVSCPKHYIISHISIIPDVYSLFQALRVILNIIRLVDTKSALKMILMQP